MKETAILQFLIFLRIFGVAIFSFFFTGAIFPVRFVFRGSFSSLLCYFQGKLTRKNKMSQFIDVIDLTTDENAPSASAIIEDNAAGDNLTQHDESAAKRRQEFRENVLDAMGC
jgi:hypothetical protein